MRASAVPFSFGPVTDDTRVILWSACRSRSRSSTNSSTCLGVAAISAVDDTDNVIRRPYRERQITPLLEDEGTRLNHRRARAREGISERGYRIGAALITRWLHDATVLLDFNIT